MTPTLQTLSRGRLVQHDSYPKAQEFQKKKVKNKTLKALRMTIVALHHQLLSLSPLQSGARGGSVQNGS